MNAVSDYFPSLQRVWDELDMWHSRLSLLENEAQDLAEERPQQGLLLMDRLSRPLQLYQDTAWLAEQRTAFLARVRKPYCSDTSRSGEC